MKTCTKCYKIKPLSEFYNDKYSKDGYTFRCKGCSDLTKLNYCKNNPWYIHLRASKQRCNDKNSIGYKRYGGRGIKCLLSMKQIKIIVEKHPDGYVAYPLGIKGVVVGQGDSYEEALSDVKSAIRFHIESFNLNPTKYSAPA